MLIKINIGDSVINPKRPDWGIGKVLGTEELPYEIIRVRVNFASAGVKAIQIPPGALEHPNTYVSEENRVKEKMGISPADTERLKQIPEIIFDRLGGLEGRLSELLKLFQFPNTPKGIFDWAVHQIGKKDPLEIFSADELEKYYREYCRKRDYILQMLFRESQKAGLEEKFYSILANKAKEELRKHIRALLTPKYDGKNL
jgi:hypothetical protein